MSEKTKIHKVIVYLIDFDDMSSPEELGVIMQNDKYLFGDIGPYETVEVDWTDDIDLNQQSATVKTYENYFRGEKCE